MHVVQHPSPNFGERRGGVTPDLIVLHYTAMKSANAALERLCDPECEVSAHYLIAEDGTAIQMVDEAHRSWHAGAGAWGATTDINSRSIGIELANDGSSPFPAAQMDALEILLTSLMKRQAIPPERVIAHSDMAPDRKGDPGGRFDWHRLARTGLSVWHENLGQPDPEPNRFRELAATFGYTADVAEENILNAVRLRFRPWATGPLDATDMGLIENLSRRFPVDQTPINA